jgi:branched-chain amino acid transport system substrate-binding protein
MKIKLLAAALLVFTVNAQSADKVKIGFISTLSGPSAAIGVDIRDAFLLAVKMNGGKLGGLPAEVLVGDDQFKPDVGRQIAEKNVKVDKVNFLTGIVFSNIMLASVPIAFENKMIYVSPNAAPSPMAGKDCNPYLFVASWPNDAYHEAAGQHATNRGYKNAYLIAPNYQAGKDSLTGFKRYYKGNVVAEVYTQLGQLDYAAELAQVRAAKPDALYIFLPGGMGINFIKQFVASGLSKDVPLIVPGFGDDQDIIRPVGEATLGLFDTAHWAIDFDNAANRKFVAAFEKEYRRLPTVFAAQGKNRRCRSGAQSDARGEVRVGARPVQVQPQPDADPELLPARGRQGLAGPPGEQDHRHGVQGPWRRVRARLQDEVSSS